VSAENVDDEIKRLRSLPAETLRRDLVSELGSATEALMASAGDRGHCEDDWWAVKIQAREDAGLAGDRTTWVETQADRDFDQLKDVDLKEIDEQQALIRLKIDSLETQIAVAAEHADRQLICFCTSAIKGAFSQHYMCKTCYDAWKRQGSNKKCPFCRETMKDPPLRFHWTPLKPTAALSAPAAQEPLPQTAHQHKNKQDHHHQNNQHNQHNKRHHHQQHKQDNKHQQHNKRIPRPMSRVLPVRAPGHKHVGVHNNKR